MSNWKRWAHLMRFEKSRNEFVSSSSVVGCGAGMCLSPRLVNLEIGSKLCLEWLKKNGREREGMDFREAMYCKKDRLLLRL